MNEQTVMVPFTIRKRGGRKLDASGNWRRIEFCDSLTGVDLAEKDRCRGRTAFGMSRID